MTYTLTEIHRINGIRTRKARFKPVQGLTMDDLNKIRTLELEKLYRKHPHMSLKQKIDELAVCLIYKEETF